MVITYIKMAIATIRMAKVRSVLTMLGIIIGVTSVLLSVAFAQGIKQETTSQLSQLGDTFITVRPGKVGQQDDLGRLKSLDLNTVLSTTTSTSTLTEQDLSLVSKVENMEQVAPVMILNGSIANGQQVVSSGTILATNADLPTVLEKKIDSGAFFARSESEKRFVVLGHSIAGKLFGSDAPLGSKIMLRGQEFTVIGVMAKEKADSVSFGPSVDEAVFVPVSGGKVLSGGDARFQFIYGKTKSASSIEQASKDISNVIKSNHGGEEDFSVIKQEDAIAFTDSLSRIITTGTALIMSISLVVAGVGIMNIMLMLVTERTREIGIRKALGATNRQISLQFFIEALVLSALGGLVGLLVSVLTVTAVDAYTDLQMTLTLRMVALALGLSISIGAVFGVLPAIKAARKDPIVALRNE